MTRQKTSYLTKSSHRAKQSPAFQLQPSVVTERCTKGECLTMAKVFQVWSNYQSWRTCSQSRSRIQVWRTCWLPSAGVQWRGLLNRSDEGFEQWRQLLNSALWSGGWSSWRIGMELGQTVFEVGTTSLTNLGEKFSAATRTYGSGWGIPVGYYIVEGSWVRNDGLRLQLCWLDDVGRSGGWGTLTTANNLCYQCNFPVGEVPCCGPECPFGLGGGLTQWGCWRSGAFLADESK